MRASKRQKKLKSASPTPTSNSQQYELWLRFRDGLSPEERKTVESETRAAQAAGGSRLAAAMHLLVVRRILCGDAVNPKQKGLWSAFLAANLPGFCLSRAQVFRDISAAIAAKALFPQQKFLDAFIAGGYALNVRPTKDAPLGKFTQPCQHILSHMEGDEPGERECLAVLSEAADIIRAEAKKNRPAATPLTVDKKRERIFADIHNSVVSRMEQLSGTNEPGYLYTLTDIRDDLELILGRLMTAAGLDELDVETKNLPNGFNRLSLPGSAVESSESDETAEAVLGTTAA